MVAEINARSVKSPEDMVRPSMTSMIRGVLRGEVGTEWALTKFLSMKANPVALQSIRAEIIIVFSLNASVSETTRW